MCYKEMVRNQGVIIARYRVIRSCRASSNKAQTAKYYWMHRNSVANILALYKQHKTEHTEHIILSSLHFRVDEIEQAFWFLSHRSRRPHTLRWTAPPSMERLVCKEFSMLWYGYRRMRNHLRNKELIPRDTNEALIKWIYKRQWFKIRKVRTKNWERRKLYNYSSISPFEYLHYDVKHILDQKALPEQIYTKFEENPDLPIYQRTIIDAKTRWRFLAYSHQINATFWRELLKFVLMFIRNQWIRGKIHVWFDWGTEFCWANEKKLRTWNKLLAVINCEAYYYDWPRDVRKNLVERSHRSDDEEFYVPRWSFISDKESFIKEAGDRFLHWNYTRVHTGIEMNMTPYQKLEESWIRKRKWREKFPVLILDECISNIMYHTKTLHLKQSLQDAPTRKSQKELVDFQVGLHILNNDYAQNVLTQYHFRLQVQLWDYIVYLITLCILRINMEMPFIYMVILIRIILYSSHKHGNGT